MDPKLEGTSDGSPGARPRAGADPARGAPRRGPTATSSCCPNRASPIDPERGLATLPPPSPGDLFFDLEGDPFAFDDGLDYLFGVLEIGRHVPRLLVARRGRRVHPRWRTARVRGRDGLLRRAAPGRPEPAHLPLRAVRADRAQAADGPLRDARGRGRRPAPRAASWSTCCEPSASRSAPRSRAIRSRGWSRSTGSPGRSTCATPDRASSPSSNGWSSVRASARPPTTSSGSSATTATTSSATCGCATGWRRCADELAEATGLDVPRPGARARHAGRLSDELRPQIQALVERLADPSDRPVDAGGADPEQHGRWLLAQLLGWHRREDKAMWWEFYRLMGLDVRAAHRRGRPDRRARAGRAGRRAAAGASRPGATRSRTRTSTSARRDALRPRAEVRPHRTTSPFDWARGDVVAVDAAALTVDIKRDRSTTPHPRCDRAARHGSGRREHQAPLRRARRVGRRPRHRCRRPAPGRARPAARAAAPGRPGTRASPFGRPGETDLEAAARASRSPSIGPTSPIQGPPGAGKTYTGARMIVTLLRAGQARRHHRHEPQGHRQPARAVLEAADDEPASTSGRSSTDRADQVRRRAAVVRAKDAGGRRARSSTTAGRTSPPGPRGCGSSPKMLDAVDVLFVDEAGQISLANVVAMSRRGREPRAARRSAAARPADAGHAPARRGPLGPGPRPRRPGDDARRIAACSSSARGGCIPSSCEFTSEVFYDDRLEPEAHLGVQRVDADRVESSTASARAGRGRRPTAPTTSRRTRPRRSPTIATARSTAAAAWMDRTASRGHSAGTTC